jgi:uncharacterized protein YjbI with pentapeptide repeats
MKSRWKQYLLYTSLIIVGGGLLFILVETVRAKNTGFETKTLWDWMDLLIVPLFLTGGAIFLNQSERKIEREILEDRQREQAFQAYVSYMTELLLEKDLANIESSENIRFAAKARTMAVLRGLNPLRKRYVLEFLRDAKLLGAIVEGMDKPTIIKLDGADFSYVDLRGVDLRFVNLEGANLQHADCRHTGFSHTVCNDADFSYANMQGTNIHWSYFDRAIMNHVNLREAVFWDMVLRLARLQFANLRKSSFENSAGFIDCDLTGANLKGARIPEGHLRLNPSKVQSCQMEQSTSSLDAWHNRT